MGLHNDIHHEVEVDGAASLQLVTIRGYPDVGVICDGRLLTCSVILVTVTLGNL